MLPHKKVFLHMKVSVLLSFFVTILSFGAESNGSATPEYLSNDGITTRSYPMESDMFPTQTVVEKNEHSRGVALNKNATDVYTGGIAIPTETYNTRLRNSDGSEGDPMYLVPNYQPVVSYNVQRNGYAYQKNTINPAKIAQQIDKSISGYPDVDYIGYYRVPDVGKKSWWSNIGSFFQGEQKNKKIQKGHTISIYGQTNQEAGALTKALKEKQIN